MDHRREKNRGLRKGEENGGKVKGKEWKKRAKRMK